MRLSQNFKLEEFLVSQTAERNGLDMTPPDFVIEHLQVLVSTCLQPLREAIGETIYISSGFRPAALNRLIGGSTTSAHVLGSAADFHAVGHSPLQVCKIIQQLLEYDQNIHEFGRWTHLGVSALPRKEDLTAYWKNGKVTYYPGLQLIEDLRS